MQRIGQPSVMGSSLREFSWVRQSWKLAASSPTHYSSRRRSESDAGRAFAAWHSSAAAHDGMETDLSVFRDARRKAVSISLAGIVVPFTCGIVLGELLPQSLLPDPAKRLITTLFLGTALSISSVKIVALVVRDLGFLRRTVGQVIIAAAIIDDTLGWVIMSVVFGLAAHAELISRRGQQRLRAAAFLAISFTSGGASSPTHPLGK